MASSLAFDHEETTPDGRLRIRRVRVRASEEAPIATELAPGIVGVHTSDLFDWYVGSLRTDRWLRYGQTSEPLPARRFEILGDADARERLVELIHRFGEPWRMIEPPISSLRDDAERFGGGYLSIADGEVLDAERFDGEDT